MKYDEIIKTAIQEAWAARDNGEDPFGAVLIDSDFNICHMSHSKCVEMSDPTAHAEMSLIREFCQQAGIVYLHDYEIVCSGEPCVMCSGAIKWAKLKKVIYSVPQSFIQGISGGRVKPSCENVVNSGKRRIGVIGNVLYEDGIKVFDNFTFKPKVSDTKDG